MNARFAVVSLVSLAACTEWSARPVPPGPQPVAIEGRVRVTRTTGQRLELLGVVVRNDSLYGTRADAVRSPPVGLALSEVARVEGAGTNITVPVLLSLATVMAVWRWLFLPAFAGG